jgi:sulfur carrier protein
MTIIVNGQARELTGRETLAGLLLVLSPSTPFAVAVNAEFVPRVAYSEHRILSGDRIDTVHPMAGG